MIRHKLIVLLYISNLEKVDLLCNPKISNVDYTYLNVLQNIKYTIIIMVTDGLIVIKHYIKWMHQYSIKFRIQNNKNNFD